MEADWAVALAAGDPVITVPWAASGDDIRQCRFVDLRQGLDSIDDIEETRTRPPLRSALLMLNAAASPFWTAKCDAWTSSVDEGAEPFDAYEMAAEPGDTTFGAGSYIDLWAREVSFLASFERQERWIRAATAALRAIPAIAARADLVLRRAEIEGLSGYAVTWFVEGCGSTAQGAAQSWTTALALALPVLIDGRLMEPQQGAW